MQRVGGGSIINISSICGIVGSHANAAYHASKGAVRIFSKAAAIQYAPDKIRVNPVHPGFVDTPMTQPGIRNSRGREPAHRRDLPSAVFGTPHDIAAGCLYLASDDASWVTGQRAGDRRRHDGELRMSIDPALMARFLEAGVITCTPIRSSATGEQDRRLSHPAWKSPACPSPAASGGRGPWRRRRGASPRSVGLRADMDALPIAELNEVAHASTLAWRHACLRHDGHTVSLLGAAALLSRDPAGGARCSRSSSLPRRMAPARRR